MDRWTGKVTNREFFELMGSVLPVVFGIGIGIALVAGVIGFLLKSLL